MSLEAGVRRARGIMNEVALLPKSVGAWFRVSNILSKIEMMHEFAVRGDLRPRIIASTDGPAHAGVWGHRRNLIELRINPVSALDRLLVEEMQLKLGDALSSRKPSAIIKASEFVDEKVMERSR